eukprot:9493978-Pyramimonas_sp.AAC.1
MQHSAQREHANAHHSGKGEAESCENHAKDQPPESLRHVVEATVGAVVPTGVWPDVQHHHLVAVELPEDTLVMPFQCH